MKTFYLVNQSWLGRAFRGLPVVAAGVKSVAVPCLHEHKFNFHTVTALWRSGRNVLEVSREFVPGFSRPLRGMLLLAALGTGADAPGHCRPSPRCLN
jgi:hypothetical protein